MAAMEVIWVVLCVQLVGLRGHWRWMRVVSPGGEVTVTGGMWMEVWPVRLTFFWLSESSGRSGGQLSPPEPCWGERARDSPSESPNRSLEQRQHVNIEHIYAAALGGRYTMQCIDLYESNHSKVKKCVEVSVAAHTLTSVWIFLFS